ncbi:MAG: T9SS type A sorting domain-containing protein [candidate division KSB1 bacterium]|nr:T9SS type A sorting domain-containing protein [candidate division KSB1 bacterium]
MKARVPAVWAALSVFFGFCALGLAQQVGDYRSVANGNWSDPATWEVFDGTQWVAATLAPTGAESITVDGTDTVKVDVPVEIRGYLRVKDTGVVMVTETGSLTFGNGGTYEHARNGGSVPTATWLEGSTALFTGITTTAPANRGQDYWNVVLNTPGLTANLDLNLAGKTISGNVTVVNTGTGRWRLVGGTSGTVTIMGDLIVQAGQFETQGTSSSTQVDVHHYGSVRVTGGEFSISRGSQGGATGTGYTRWYLHQGDFFMSNATTRNSNPWRATFVFAKVGGVQNLVLENVTFLAGGLPVKVDSGVTLNLGTSVLGGDGSFVLSPGATLRTALPGGLDQALATTGSKSLSKQASYTFDGVEAQVPGALLPDSVATLTVANPEGVTFTDTLWAHQLEVNAGSLMRIDSLGVVTVDSGGVAGAIWCKGVLTASDTLYFMSGSVYDHARDAGSLPNGRWAEGSTLLLSGTVQNAPSNRNQNFHHVVFNTPNLTKNLSMGWDGVTIGGDIRVVSTGLGRWYMSTAAVGDTAVITVLGDVIVENGNFSVHGTGNAQTVFLVHHYGDVVVTGGNFSIARGSQGNGSGKTIWYLYEGDFWMSNATTQNSNPTPGNAKFVFVKPGVQRLVLGAVNNIQNLPIEVCPGTTLDVGNSVLAGTGIFVVREGATLATAHTGGVAGFLGTVAASGVALSKSANYVFNGTEPQVTSTSLPDTVSDLVINNPAGVALSRETTINGVLRLMSGEFDNTVPFTLGPTGRISFEGGSLKVPLVASEYRSVATGNWSQASTWEAFLFGRWMAAPMAPTGSEQITIRNADTVRVDMPVVVRGYVKIQDSGVLVVEGGSLTFADSSYYEHARDGGILPSAVWEPGSTLLLTGIVENAPANRNQNFHHVVFNTPNLTKNLNMGWDGVTIGGDIRVVSTGLGRWYMSTAAVGDTAVITVLGDVVVEGGHFSVHGTGNAQTVFWVHHYGDVVVTGGNFSIARGSQGNGSGKTIWYLYEGDFSMSNATTQNSNPTLGNAKFVFAKTGLQRLVLGAGNNIQNLPIEVSSGTTLDVGTSVLAGQGMFALNAGATLAIAHPAGVAGFLGALPANVVSLSEAANFVFNGTEHQVTSTLMPSVVNDLTIANLAGVELSQATTINGVLHLVAGEFDNTVPFALGPNGRISYEGGTLKVPLVASEYRSVTTGNWSSASTWEGLVGDRWLAVPAAPVGTEKITVRGSDTVKVDVPLEFRGYLKVEESGVVTVTTGSLAFLEGSVYEHARDAGILPLAEWRPGSTLLMTGTVQDAPANRNQNFYHVVFNTPNLTRNRDMGWDDVTIGGDIRVISTGQGRWYLTTAAANDTAIVTLMGDVIVEGGAFSVQGTSNALTTFIVHHYGNIRVTGGNFSISRGSQGNGSGTTTWYLYQGDFSMSNATTQNSNPTPGNAKFVFAKAGVQKLELGEGNTILKLPIEVRPGTTLEVGQSVLAGNDIFVLSEGATLALTHPDGVAGFLGSVPNELVTLSPAANFWFHGSLRQVTSTRMPNVVNDLIIDNPAGVVLSQPTTINGVLRLVAGECDNTIPFTLGPNGRISYEGGTLKVPVGVAGRDAAVPAQFALHQNYPNPFNANTTIRYELPTTAHVVLKIYDVTGREIAELVNAKQGPGIFTVTWSADGLPSGIYYCRMMAGEFVAMRKLVLMK